MTGPIPASSGAVTLQAAVAYMRQEHEPCAKTGLPCPWHLMAPTDVEALRARLNEMGYQVVPLTEQETADDHTAHNQPDGRPAR